MNTLCDCLVCKYSTSFDKPVRATTKEGCCHTFFNCINPPQTRQFFGAYGPEDILTIILDLSDMSYWVDAGSSIKNGDCPNFVDIDEDKGEQY